jgi:hypothetical protein
LLILEPPKASTLKVIIKDDYHWIPIMLNTVSARVVHPQNC